MKTKHIISRPSFLLGLLFAAVALSPIAAQASPVSDCDDTYPLLPDLPGADINGQARIAIHLEHGVPLVEVDGQLYTIGDRPLEVALDDLERLTLLFIVPEGTGLFVTEQGLWIDELDPAPTSQTLTFDLVDPLLAFGFEVASPGQPGPTIPDLVILPTENDPPPARTCADDRVE